MSRILIIEDEPSMRMGLEDNLDYEGYEVESAADGPSGLKRMMEGQFDLILLDVMLPGISGFDICKQLRKNGNMIPIILLTAKGEEIDKVLGLELGADDYITKPFSLRELMARIKAVLRRGSASVVSVKGERIQIGRLDIDFSTYDARENELSIKLSHKEFEILKYLWENRQQTVSRYDLLDNIWGYDDEQPTTRTVDNFIVKLRQKIEANPNEPHIILTVHGIGYKMII